MRRTVMFVIFTALAMAPLAAVAGAPTAFSEMAGHYEAIRQALLHDTIEGVAEHARAIAEEAKSLQGGADASTAGVAANQGAECASLLPEVEKVASELATATSLDAARQAFGELSKPMVRYREMASGHRPMVVYCPMAKQSWLQPAGEIGNPYYGQSMARCGQVVSEATPAR